ncbi:MAG: DUF481 domain-containing protein [Oceanipulchritudo sp.]
MKFPFFISLFLIAFLPVSGQEEDSKDRPDRLEIGDGAVLTGFIEMVDAEGIHLVTDYAGTLKVDPGKVEQVVLGTERETGLPAELLDGEEEEEKEEAFTEVSPPVAIAPTEEAVPTPSIPKENPPDWKLEVGVNLTGKEGNTDRLDVAFRVEAEMERQFDRLNLYGRYSYGTNNGVTSSDELIVGARYVNFLLNKTGIFLREEFEQDKFEGLESRSTTAAGLTYQFRNDERLRIEARSGFSYRYENYTKGGSDEFPGMDIGFDVTWRFVEWARFKGSYTFLPSVDTSLDEFIFEQDSGFDFPLDKKEFWRLRLGFNSQYNSDVEPGRKNLDSRFYVRLSAAWD